MTAKTKLEQDIRRVLNSASAEVESGTPDYVLARYLLDCLDAFNRAVNRRERSRNPVDVPNFLRKDQAAGLV